MHISISRRWHLWLLSGFLVLAVFLTYANSFENTFLFDDEFLIIKNMLLRSWTHFFDIFRLSSTGGAAGVDSFYRPLQTLSYLFIYQIFGDSPWGFHLLNTTLHALNVVLVFRLGLKLKISPLYAWGAALLWGLHPLHTEAITYMSATADTGHSFFCLLGMNVLAHSVEKKNLLTGLLCMIGGLLFKESAIVFPALVTVTLFATSHSDKKWRIKNYLPTIPYWTVAFIYLILRKTILNFDQTFDFYKTQNIYTEHILYRTYTFLATLPDFFRLLIWPDILTMERNFPVFVDLTALPVLLGLFAVVICLVYLFKNRNSSLNLLSWGILWFSAAHTPHTGILLPVNSLFLEHWFYLPSVGLFLGFASWLSQVLNNKRTTQNIIFSLVLAIAIALAVRTYEQNKTWQNPITFYEHILEQNPKAQRPLNNIAMAYSEAQQYDKAIAYYLKAIELGDIYPQTRHNLGLAYINTGQVELGITQLKRAIEINPDFHQSYAILAQVYEQLHDTKNAEYYSTKYKEIRSRFGP